MADENIEIATRHYAECQYRADSFNQEDRTVDVIFATEAPVKRYSFSEGYFMEVLDCQSQSVRMERFEAMSFLDTHDNWSMDYRLGSVVKGSVRIENGKCYATIKLSRNENGEKIFQDLVDGHPLPISVGYKIHRYEKTEASEDSLPTLRAMDWEPTEISAVPVPADAGAHSRSEESKTERVLVRQAASNAARTAAATQEHIMDKRKAAQELTGEQLTGFALGQGIARNENETDAALSKRLLAHFDKQEKDAEAAEQERQAELEAARQESTAAENQAAGTEEVAETNTISRADADEIARKASRAEAAAERKRQSDIRKLADEMGFADKPWVRAALDDGSTLQEFRNMALDKVIEGEERTPTQTSVGTGGGLDETQTRRDALANAIMHRHDSESVELLDSAREWRGLSLINAAREYLRQCGELQPGMNDSQVAERALHGTTDFPIILGDVVRTRLLAGYNAYPNTFQLIAIRNTVTNFKEIRAARFGENPELRKVNEHGEFPRGTMVEGVESYKIATYGRIIGVTRQMLINDELGALARVPNRWGRQIAKLEGDIVWDMIVKNAVMSSDGNALFHTDHTNLDGTGRAIDVSGLKEGRKHFRKQTDIDGNRIDLAPKYLFVTTDDEVDAQQLLQSNTTPTKTADVVPEAIRSLTPVSEHRLDVDSGPRPWYLFADKADLDAGLEFAYLAGNEEPFTDEQMGFNVDGVEWKVRHDFGAGLTDWRFGYKNPGV